MAGLTGNTNLISSSIQYVINFVMTIPAILFVDRWGRRMTLMLGSAFMAVCLFTVAGLLAGYGHYVDSVDGNEDVKWVVTGPPSKGVIAACYLFVAAFAVSWVSPHVIVVRPEHLADLYLLGPGQLDLHLRDLVSYARRPSPFRSDTYT